LNIVFTQSTLQNGLRFCIIFNFLRIVLLTLNFSVGFVFVYFFYFFFFALMQFFIELSFRLCMALVSSNF
jgi:hypothetical protein